jgi:hypothetical protein
VPSGAAAGAEAGAEAGAAEAAVGAAGAAGAEAGASAAKPSVASDASARRENGEDSTFEYVADPANMASAAGGPAAMTAADAADAVADAGASSQTAPTAGKGNEEKIPAASFLEVAETPGAGFQCFCEPGYTGVDCSLVATLAEAAALDGASTAKRGARHKAQGMQVTSIVVAALATFTVGLCLAPAAALWRDRAAEEDRQNMFGEGGDSSLESLLSMTSS